MTQRFIKGYTNNHLTWVMVDATDFATPESALSAATTIKIYGKVKGATGVNFVSSGTGSLTNDIQHVGASATGIYTIALAKADLSDASNAWYDQYVITLSGTGAARQTLVVDGGVMESYLSAAVSDAASAAILGASHASDAASYALVIQSRLSDFQSVYSSDFSDLYSLLSDTRSTMDSQFAVTSNYLSNASNFQSDILSTLGSQFAVESNYLSYISATVSGLGAGQTASAIADKVWSDYGSKVGATPSQAYSVALRAASFSSDAASGVTVLQSRITSTAATSSDLVSKIWSDFQSKMGVSPSQLYSVTLVGASAASDAASAAQQANSRVLLVQSRLSDFQSVYASDISDVRSMLTALSDAISNVDSAVNSQYSDLESKLTSQFSDMASKVGAVSVALSASDISDISSQILAGIGTVDANVVEVNGHAVTGSGTAGDPWRPL